MVDVSQARDAWADERSPRTQPKREAVALVLPEQAAIDTPASVGFPCRDHRTKRFFDVVVSALGLIVLSPLMAIIWFAIVSTSPGPALFTSRRVGRYGRPFLMPKFRTMRKGAETRARETLTRAGEQITWVGGVLRRFGLDELPQLWCVLRGDMSLIGPRPLLADDPGTLERVRFPAALSMRPGISGLSQVSGRNLVSPRRKARLDAFYARSASLGFDFRIMGRTVSVIISGKGFM